MQLADEVSFGIYSWKMREIKFQKIIPKFFDRAFQELFMGSSKKGW